LLIVTPVAVTPPRQAANGGDPPAPLTTAASPPALPPVVTGCAADPLDGLPPLVPVPTAAKVLGLSRSAAYRYASIGALPARRLGGRVYVVTALLRALVLSADDPGTGAA
jgi:hypothetical protein